MKSHKISNDNHSITSYPPSGPYGLYKLTGVVTRTPILLRRTPSALLDTHPLVLLYAHPPGYVGHYISVLPSSTLR